MSAFLLGLVVGGMLGIPAGGWFVVMLIRERHPSVREKHE